MVSEKEVNDGNICKKVEKKNLFSTFSQKPTKYEKEIFKKNIWNIFIGGRVPRG